MGMSSLKEGADLGTGQRENASQESPTTQEARRDASLPPENESTTPGEEETVMDDPDILVAS